MGSLDVTLLVVAGLLALTVAVARLERRPLGTGSSDVGPGLILALGAAVMFWFTFMVGAAAVNAYTGGSSHDWGPAVTFSIAMIGAAVFRGGGGLSPRGGIGRGNPFNPLTAPTPISSSPFEKK